MELSFAFIQVYICPNGLRLTVRKWRFCNILIEKQNQRREKVIGLQEFNHQNAELKTRTRAMYSYQFERYVICRIFWTLRETFMSRIFSNSWFLKSALVQCHRSEPAWTRMKISQNSIRQSTFLSFPKKAVLQRYNFSFGELSTKNSYSHFYLLRKTVLKHALIWQSF